MYTGPTPKVKKLTEIIGELKKIVENHKVDMGSGTIDPNALNNPCGTPGCHGGWLALAMKTSTADWELGAEQFAKFIGFKSRQQLKDWAGMNPNDWGNKHGASMFYSGQAFGRNSDIFPAQVLVDHWEGVIDRLLAVG